jgi:hypothetical protein
MVSARIATICYFFYAASNDCVGLLIAISEKEEASKFGLMDQDTKDTGKPTKPMDMEDLYMLMEMFTKVNGKMIRPMAKELTLMLMAQSMKENGLKISNMDWVLRDGPMVLLTKANTCKERSTEEANSCGQMEAPTLENSMITIFMDQVFMNGLMVGSLLENGRIIKWRVTEPLLGLMEENM